MAEPASIPLTINPPSNISADMDLWTALRVYVIPTASVIVITQLANAAIDKAFEKDEKQDVNQLYDSMMKQIESSKLPRTEEAPEMKNMRDMSSLIEDSIYSLEKARRDLEMASGKTKCGVCVGSLSKLTDTIKNDVSEVQNNTRGILSASKKYSALQHLKTLGTVDKNKGWNDLNEYEKDLVREFVEE